MVAIMVRDRLKKKRKKENFFLDIFKPILHLVDVLVTTGVDCQL